MRSIKMAKKDLRVPKPCGILATASENEMIFLNELNRTRKAD